MSSATRCGEFCSVGETFKSMACGLRLTCSLNPRLRSPASRHTRVLKPRNQARRPEGEADQETCNTRHSWSAHGKIMRPNGQYKHANAEPLPNTQTRAPTSFRMEFSTRQVQSSHGLSIILESMAQALSEPKSSQHLAFAATHTNTTRGRRSRASTMLTN